jgi:hypothetical protein
LPRELVHEILSAYKGYTGKAENQSNVVDLQSHRFKKESDEEFKEENNQNSKVVNFPF